MYASSLSPCGRQATCRVMGPRLGATSDGDQRPRGLSGTSCPRQPRRKSRRWGPLRDSVPLLDLGVAQRIAKPQIPAKSSLPSHRTHRPLPLAEPGFEPPLSDRRSAPESSSAHTGVRPVSRPSARTCAEASTQQGDSGGVTECRELTRGIQVAAASSEDGLDEIVRRSSLPPHRARSSPAYHAEPG
jgi:hypothetical protein